MPATYPRAARSTGSRTTGAYGYRRGPARRRVRCRYRRRTRRGGHAGGILGCRHGVLKFGKRTRQPRRQAVRQQAEGRVALRAVPASDACSERRLALVGAVPRQRAAAVRMVRAPLKPCLTPCLGDNVPLAGKPRLVAKLHRHLGPAAAVGGRSGPPIPLIRSEITKATPNGEPQGVLCPPAVRIDPASPEIRQRNNPKKNGARLTI